MLNWTIERIEILLLIAALVAMGAQRLRLPYTAGLVAAGMALALTPYFPHLALTKELIYGAFLPPLVFEAAYFIKWRNFRNELVPLVTFATVGVTLAAGLTAAGMHFVAGWEWAAAGLFGALIAATDPVSVIAVFKEAKVKGRVRLLVEGESLLNDGVAAVLFGVVLALTQGARPGVVGVATDLALSIAGGVVCGLVVGAVAILLAGRTEDHLVEITFTTVAAYGSFMLAEHLQVSGVLATLTAGLFLGNIGHLGAISERGHDAVESFWEYAAFVVNSLVFLLIGVREAHEAYLGVLVPLAAAVVLVLVGRAVSVYALSAALSFSRWRIAPSHQHVLFWGGLRGALALALVMSLPPGTVRRSEMTAVAFGVVAVSILVQGVTMRPLLRRLGVIA